MRDEYRHDVAGAPTAVAPRESVSAERERGGDSAIGRAAPTARGRRASAAQRCSRRTSAVVTESPRRIRVGAPTVVELASAPRHGERRSAPRTPTLHVKIPTSPLLRQPVATSRRRGWQQRTSLRRERVAPRPAAPVATRRRAIEGATTTRGPGRAKRTMRPTTASAALVRARPRPASASGSGAKRPRQKDRVRGSCRRRSSASQRGEVQQIGWAATPTSTEARDTPATSPPLSATPCGRDHGPVRRARRGVEDLPERVRLIGQLTHGQDHPRSRIGVATAPAIGEVAGRRGGGRHEADIRRRSGRGQARQAERNDEPSHRRRRREQQRVSPSRRAATELTNRGLGRSGRSSSEENDEAKTCVGPGSSIEHVPLPTLGVDHERQVAVGDHRPVRHGLRPESRRSSRRAGAARTDPVRKYQLERWVRSSWRSNALVNDSRAVDRVGDDRDEVHPGGLSRRGPGRPGGTPAR